LTNSLKDLQQDIGYEFSDEKLLQQALTHRSAGATNYERLEFLGDSILNFTITSALYSQQMDATEGELSRLRASLVNKDVLYEIATALDIGQYLSLGQGERRSGGQKRKSIQADAVEAIFGSVLLDGGIESCQALILRLYNRRLSNLPDAELLKDPKTRLQEFLQGRGMGLPDYQVLSESGKDHEKYFEVACKVADLEMIRGQGKSRRKAEQDAAEKTLTRLSNG